MGNSQSNAGSCPQGSQCRRALCWGPGGPQEKDDDEWFGNLPREKRRKKKSRSSSSKNVNKMPVVHEESVSSDTIDESLSPPEARHTHDGGADAPVESPSLSNKKVPLMARSKSSDPVNNKKMKIKRQPKTKLTFVNGQFVDLLTEEGREIVEAASLESGGESGAIRGILSSSRSEHVGILGPSHSNAHLNAVTVQSLGKLYGYSRAGSKASQRTTSDMSTGSVSESVTSSVGSIDSARDSVSTKSALTTSDVKDAVSSIVDLGKGHFLTASKCDRVIKMWKLVNIDGKSTLQFVRDFVGHSTGITCLAKVDAKGRFLSGSKDRVIKLWDSRFNCDDSGDDPIAHQILLATFDKMDRRSILDITIMEDGKYVRPTDKVDMAMAGSMIQKAVKEGSGAVQKAAQERQIIGCSCEFATISGRHPVVKMWSMKHIDQPNDKPFEGGNVAEVKLEQELKHDAVVESITSVRKKGLILTGDRMGNCRLWRSGINAKVYSCVRTFSWRNKSELSTVEETMQFAITSLTFLKGNAMLVSGSRSGNLRVWNVDGTKTHGEIVKKEVICVTGAHNQAITAIQQGPQVKDGGSSSVSFSSASEDGKVLSFSIPVEKNMITPSCLNVVNHGIANRYIVDKDQVSVTALACLNMPEKNAQDMLITGTTHSSGNINVLKTPSIPAQGQQRDALVLHRQAMEEESLTLYAIAEKLSNGGGVESRNRKLQMKSYKNVFLGCDLVSYLVDNEYAASREDAIALGNVLATHLSLFTCVTMKGKVLADDAKSYCRFTCEFSNDSDPKKKTFNKSSTVI